MLRLSKDGLKNLPRNYLRRWQASSLTRNVSKVYGGSLISTVIAFGTSLLLIRGLSVDEYASYTVFYTISTLIPGLVGSGVNIALVRFSADYLSKQNRRLLEFYFVVFLFEAILYIVVCIVLFYISDKIDLSLFGSSSYRNSFRYGLISGFWLLLTNACVSVYQAEERFGAYVKRPLVQQTLAFLIISSLFLLKRINFLSAILTIISVNMLVSVVTTYGIFRDFNFRRTLAFIKNNDGLIREFLSSTKWLIAYFLVLNALGRVDIFMLSHFSAKEELANYGVALRYYSMSLILLGAINITMLPKFSKVDMQNKETQKIFAYNWLRRTIWLIIPIAILDLIGKPVFIWVNGSQYERSFYIFVVFSIGAWLSLMFSPLVNIIMSRKEFGFLFTLSVAALMLSLIGNYLLVPLWGGLGASLISILSSSVINSGTLMKVFR